MKVVRLSVSENDYKKYFRKKPAIAFADLKEEILVTAFHKNMGKSVQLAAKSGLSKMSLKEINAEIEKVRKCA